MTMRVPRVDCLASFLFKQFSQISTLLVRSQECDGNFATPANFGFQMLTNWFVAGSRHLGGNGVWERLKRAVCEQDRQRATIVAVIVYIPQGASFQSSVFQYLSTGM